MGNLFNRCAACVLAYVLLTLPASAETIPATATGGYVWSANWTSFTGTWLEVLALNDSSGPCTIGTTGPGQSYPYGAAPDGYSSHNSGGTLSEPTGSTSQINCYLKTPAGNWGGWYSPAGSSATKQAALYSCPAGQGWTLSGSSCTRPDCDTGYDRNASGQCVKDCTGKAGMPTTNGDYTFDGGTSTWAVSGCKVYCPQRVISAYGGSGYGCKYTGASANPDDPSAEPMQPDPEKLPPENPNDCLSQGQGYISSSTGKTTCVPAQDAPDGQKPQKLESDSSKESGTPGADGKPDPSSADYKKEEKSTTSEGGKTTESTTTTTNPGTDANGNPTCPAGATLTDGKCVSKTSSMQDTTTFCQKNPTDPTCKGTEKNDNSKFGGNCEAGFTCEGDAAQCASAKASYELRCRFEADSTTGLHDELNPGGTSGQISAGQAALNSDGAGDINIADKFSQNQQAWVNFSSGCPVGVQSFSILGKQLEIDATIVCDIGLFIRLMVHIAAYMGLARVFATKLV